MNTENNYQQSIVIGVDPGLGVKSPLGIVAFFPSSKKIILNENIQPFHKSRTAPLILRLTEISDQVRSIISGIKKNYPDYYILLSIECFVMRGKGGESLQRLIGAIYAASHGHISDIIEVQNTTVKRTVGNTGKSDKADVAEGVATYFSSNKTSTKIINKLITNEEWDMLDAFAIAITGHKVNEKS